MSDVGILESLEGLTWLYQTLSGDATLMGLISGVFPTAAPPNTPQTEAYVVLGVQSATDMNNASAARMLSSDLFSVRVCGPLTLFDSNLKPAATRIDALLTRQSGTTSSAVITACYREQELAYQDPNLVNGVVWLNLGGLYRLLITAK